MFRIPKKMTLTKVIFFFTVIIIIKVYSNIEECGSYQEIPHQAQRKIVHSNQQQFEDEATVVQVVNQVREEIENEIKFVYQYENIFIKERMKMLALNEGGRPIRSLLVTTWRSGSTFVGDIISSVPGSFLYFQPLADNYVHQVRAPPESLHAQNRIHNFLKCSFKNYFLQMSKNRHLTALVQLLGIWKQNQLFWKYCQMNPNCWNPLFFQKLCELFPYQMMKITGSRLHVLEGFLKDERYGVKIVLMVRDPRGTMVSRSQLDWCTEAYPSCSNPAYLCSDLLADYATAIRFKKDYPHSFRVLRFEDLTREVEVQTRKVFKFLGLPENRKTDKFLLNNTQSDGEGAYSIQRKTKEVASRWKRKADYDFIQRVEKSCGTALKVWGYHTTHNESHMRTFDPVSTLDKF